MTGCLSRWTVAAVLWIAFTSLARAETLADTIEQWGLLGSWAVDCAIRPDRDKGALLTYEIRKDGRVMYRRDFGEIKDENEVVSATVNAEGLLNVMVYFPSLRQTREFGLMLTENGSLRAIYNRDERGAYTIKDGKNVKTGAPTPPQQRCYQSSPRA
ncbi:hypothetical protein [Bradyrhizobium guangdongense]|uniref:Uncharacterized protein n=1 Tax=Bradyrhizobium guangdongense TaxID=1325090 RepID=A0A410VBG8_9BRAD|nr:hypothetical protein [Bradyrhizobium guangdongense]QAU41073.1 hypothetical protein X265_27880 [Bradyrhizobium guangdongense]QOZ62134.1 hypothetical protein XH86_27915 [Bradyrhizobium guangdongense]GGI21056.1 hypothetical protein GCM10010987_12410 [Bradyrhizobium guangdongense]